MIKFEERYTDEMLEYCRSCLEQEPLKGEDGQHLQNKRGDLIYPKGSFPTIAGFAIKIGMCRGTLYNWAKARDVGEDGEEGDLKYPEFSDAFKRLSDYQRAILIPGGLNGTFNSHFAAFFAVNNFDEYENHTKSTVSADIKSTNINANFEIDENSTHAQAAEVYMRMVNGAANE